LPPAQQAAHENRTPQPEFAQAKEETKQRDKIRNTIHFHKYLKQSTCLFTRPRGPDTNIQTKMGQVPNDL
jgi:hypothetical protein